GILHFRNQPFQWDVSGDFLGTLRTSTNANLDLATGNGNGFGSFVLAGTWDATGDTGTFEGSFSGTIDGGLFSGKFVGHGTGDFAGMKLMGTFAETGPGTGVFILEGIILDPHG
ncbi:MAG: hypothetical protein GTO40_10935, partial [Deltaproteobacteria bacterium]|nr:hypothetical protein [Deltaproteobacteria bacterium]